MLHHISFPVADLARSRDFYLAALGALGFGIVNESRGYVGFGLAPDEDAFAIKQVADAGPAGPGFHLAFAAQSRTEVDAFHQAAMAQGAVDNGGPGLRTHYGPTYYAAFVIDPDGHRIEVVHK